MNPDAHYRTTGPELLADLSKPLSAVPTPIYVLYQQMHLQIFRELL